VADVICYSAKGYFRKVSTGFDGWLLRIHPGMTPINGFTQGVLIAPIGRIISAFYIIAWDMECHNHVNGDEILEREKAEESRVC
jgi:hypothetical protein